MKISNFKSVVQKYKVVFFDSFGVLKNSKGLIDGIENTLDYLKENNIDFYILTNDASRSPEALAESSSYRHIKAITPHKIISSGMLAKEYLIQKVRKGTIAYLGTEQSAHYIESAGLKTISIADLQLDNIGDVSAICFLDDEGFDWERDLNKVVNLLRKRNIPAIVANTDNAYPTSKEEVAIAIGGVADMVEQVVGKQFIRFGKPDAQLFIFAYDHIYRVSPVNKRKILMVGDTLGTDIIGGNKFGLDTALVLTGNTLPDQYRLLMQTTGILPDYVCHSAVIE